MFSKITERRVLVVDDDEDVLRSMKTLLELSGFDVKTIASGEEAIREMGNRQYDLLILDVSMPRVDGVELYRKVKSVERYKDVPIMFTSGYPAWTEPEEQRREIFREAEAYMQKPFNVEVFVKTVRRLIGKQVPTNGSGPPIAREVTP